MRYKSSMMLLPIALLSLGGCQQRVYPQGLTLGELGPNMQIQMEEALAQSGYWNTQPQPSDIAKSELHWKNF